MSKGSSTSSMEGHRSFLLLLQPLHLAPSPRQCCSCRTWGQEPRHARDSACPGQDHHHGSGCQNGIRHRLLGNKGQRKWKMSEVGEDGFWVLSAGRISRTWFTGMKSFLIIRTRFSACECRRRNAAAFPPAQHRVRTPPANLVECSHHS